MSEQHDPDALLREGFKQGVNFVIELLDDCHEDAWKVPALAVRVVRGKLDARTAARLGGVTKRTIDRKAKSIRDCLASNR